MRNTSFRYCMLIAALALGGVAAFHLSYYLFVIRIALGNSGVQAFVADSMRAMWLTFSMQALLIAVLYALVAFRPRAISRPVIVLLGLLQLTEAVLLFTFAGSLTVALLLIAAAVFVLAGAVLWPQAVAATTAPPPPPAATAP